MTIADIRKSTEAKMDQSIASFQHNLTNKANALAQTIQQHELFVGIDNGQRKPGQTWTSSDIDKTRAL